MDRLLDLDALEALHQVTSTGSFDGAAEQLGITQSAVSQRVKNYEKKAGVQLIRRGRPCMPTPIGEKFLEFRESVMFSEATLQTEVDVEKGDWAQGARVTIAVSNDTLACWLTDVMSRASSELDVVFEVQTNDEVHAANLLMSGKAHATLSSISTNYEALCNRKIKLSPLGAMEFVAVAAPEFVEKHFADGVTLRSIGKAVCIAYDNTDSLPDEWLRGVFGKTVPLKAQFVPSSEGHIRMVVGGAGWALVPAPSVADYIANGELVELLPTEPFLMSLHWNAVQTPKRIMEALTKIVEDEARNSLIDDEFRSTDVVRLMDRRAARQAAQ